MCCGTTNLHPRQLLVSCQQTEPSTWTWNVNLTRDWLDLLLALTLTIAFLLGLICVCRRFVVSFRVLISFCSLFCIWALFKAQQEIYFRFKLSLTAATSLTRPEPCVAFLKVASYAFMWLGNTRILNAKRVKLMNMFFVLNIGMAVTIKLSLDFATPPLLLFTWNLGDRTHPNKIGICIVPGILDLMALESINLWLPYINFGKNLANTILPFIAECLSSGIN